MKGFCCWAYLAREAARGREGKVWKEGGGHTEEVASCKENEFKTRVQNRYPICDQNGSKMVNIDTLFMTKTAEKPYTSGLPYLYSPYKGVPPSPGSHGYFMKTKDILSRLRIIFGV